MKNVYKVAVLSLCCSFGIAAYAGNPDRSGGAGATQLLVNPWGRSAGMGGINTASIRGVEAFHFNIAGLAYTERTEIAFGRTSYLQGTGININAFGLAQALGSSGNVIGLSMTSWDFGTIPITTEDQPDGTLGTFSPQIMNFALAFSKKFSNSITGGISVRYLTEGITNVRSNGVALDFGVQYQTSLNPKNKIKKEDFRFGVAVKNIGPDMSYYGSGLSFKTVIDQGSQSQRTTLMPTAAYNLPALVHIGASYDLRLDRKEDEYLHKLTPSANFTYNAFSANNLGVGAEYNFRDAFMIRGGYTWQEGINSTTDYRTQYTGWSAGATVQLPISKSGTMIGIDYGYSPTRVFNGIHNIGIRLLLGSKKS
jgi:hypothetical protein